MFFEKGPELGWCNLWMKVCWNPEEMAWVLWAAVTFL